MGNSAAGNYDHEIAALICPRCGLGVQVPDSLRELQHGAAPRCPKCGGWAAWDERTGTCASCGFVRTQLLVSRERLREQIAADPDVETEAGMPEVPAEYELDAIAALLTSAVSQTGDWHSRARYLFDRGIRIQGAGSPQTGTMKFVMCKYCGRDYSNIWLHLQEQHGLDPA